MPFLGTTQFKSLICFAFCIIARTELKVRAASAHRLITLRDEPGARSGERLATSLMYMVKGHLRRRPSDFPGKVADAMIFSCIRTTSTS